MAVHAGTFRVVPTKVPLDAGVRTAVLRVTNAADTPLTLQLEPMAWSQQAEEGEDRYAPTKDIVVFPRILRIERNGEKTIRIGYQGDPPGPRELAYRLYLEELPISTPGEATVKMTVRVGVPIFVRPAADAQQRAIESVTLRQGQLQVLVTNGGTRHLVVKGLRTTGLDGSAQETFSRDAGGWYVLAGARKAFYVDTPEEACRQSRLLRVQVLLEQAAMEARLAVDPAECGTPPREAPAPDGRAR